MRFWVTLERDEDGMWVAECPAIPGCCQPGGNERRSPAKRAGSDSIVSASARGARSASDRGNSPSIPNHKQVGKGTLRSLIRSAGLTVAEVLDALEASR